MGPLLRTVVVVKVCWEYGVQSWASRWSSRRKGRNDASTGPPSWKPDPRHLSFSIRDCSRDTQIGVLLLSQSEPRLKAHWTTVRIPKSSVDNIPLKILNTPQGQFCLYRCLYGLHDGAVTLLLPISSKMCRRLMDAMFLFWIHPSVRSLY